MIFVTANLKGCREPRQGWLLPTSNEFIIGESGARYEIEGEIFAVSNPPSMPSEQAMSSINNEQRNEQVP